MPPRKRPSLREKVTVSPDPSRPATPEPTTSSGVSRGRALYDNSPPDSQADDLGRTQRRRRSTSRGITWAEAIEKSATRSHRVRRTRARNSKKKKAHTSVPGAFHDAENTDGESQGTSANPLTNRSDDDEGNETDEIPDTGNETDDVPESIAAPEPQDSATQNSSAGAGSSSGDFVYIDRQKFVEVASAALGEDLSNESTQALQYLYDFRSAYQTPPLDTTSRGSSIVLLPGQPLGTGGGWHQDHPAISTTTMASLESGSSRAHKRRSTGSNSESSKRQRTENFINDSNTNTISESDIDIDVEVLPNTDAISESDFELEPFPPPLFQSTPLPSAPAPLASSAVELPRNPLYVSTGSLSLGGSHRSPRGSHHSPHANSGAQPPVRTYSGSRSHATSDIQDQRTEPRDSAAPTQSSSRTPAAAHSQISGRSQPTSPTQPTSHARPTSRAGPTSRTYPTAGYWPTPRPQQPELAPASNSQHPPQPRPNPNALPKPQAGPTLRTQPPPPTQSTSRAQRWMPHTPTPIPEPPRRPRPDTNVPPATQTRPTTSSQRLSQLSQRRTQCSSPRHVQASSSTQRSVRGVQDHRPPSRDPAAVAKAAMVEFNRAEAQDEARRIAESAARHLEHIERERERRSPSPSYRMLEDDEEIRACAKAVVSGIPKVSRRKKKPVASDSTGLSGQVLTLAKLALFALACSKGPYQTRGRFIHWARQIHERVWNNEAPDVPYIAATQGELEVMVNNLASLRGRVKEYLRPVIVTGYGFKRFAVSQEDIQFNRDLYATLCPNNFHCTEFSPRSGHYENEEIFSALAAGLFNGPNSVGALFEEYFVDMPLQVVAFILAMMQFCIEEWSNGWFEAKDLSAGNMLEKYEAHLFGLKEALAVAEGRIVKLQEKLFTFGQDYALASTSRHNGGQERIHRSEIRPDTPPPTDDEYDEDVPAEYQDEEDVPIEFNEAGRLTSRAKGKGRAN